MTSSPQTPRKRLSAATLVLGIAAAVAVGSVGAALWRSYGGSHDSPAAKDWRVVGWAYAEAGDAQSSAAAYRRAAAIEPGNAENWSSLAESLQTASATVVPEATEALAKAIKLNAADPRARYFLAVQKDLRGDHRGAVADWLALLKDTPGDAPWRGDLLRTINQVASQHRIDVGSQLAQATSGPVATAAIPGPTREQLAAASSIPPGQQDAMARGMVERLAARLEANPRDADGWIRLMRSYMVLNEPDRASQALGRGLAAFQGDVSAQGRLRSAAAELGVRGG